MTAQEWGDPVIDQREVTVVRERLARMRTWIHVIGEKRWVAWDSCGSCHGKGEVPSWPPEWWNEDRDGPWDGELNECPICSGTGERGTWVFVVRERLHLPVKMKRRAVRAQTRRRHAAMQVKP